MPAPLTSAEVEALAQRVAKQAADRAVEVHKRQPSPHNHPDFIGDFGAQLLACATQTEARALLGLP